MSFIKQTRQVDVSEGQPEEMGDLGHGESTDGRVLPPPADYEDGDGEEYVRVDESPERAPPRLDSDEDFPQVGASSPRPRRISVARRPGPKCKTRGTKTRWTAFDPANPPSQSRSPSPARSEEAVEQSTLQRAPAVKRKTRGNTEAAMEVDVYSSSSDSVAPPPLEKRGRRRPGSTGEFVGLRKAKSALVEKEQEYLRLLAERELLESWTEPSVTRSRSARLNRTASLPEASAPSSGAGDGVLATLSKPPEEMTSEELMGQLRLAVSAVERITGLKKGNKGTSIGVLKQVAKVMSAAGLELSRRTQTEETKRVMEENTNLKREAEEARRATEESARLKCELKEARRALEEANARHSREMEDLRRELREMGSRVAEIELRPSPPASPLPPRPRERSRSGSPFQPHGNTGESGGTRDPLPRGRPVVRTVEEVVPGTVLDGLVATILGKVGIMVDAKLGAIVGRLPPEKPLRPPLGVRAGAPEGTGAPNVARGPAGANGGGGQKSKGSNNPRPAAADPAPRSKKGPQKPVVVPRQRRPAEAQPQESPPPVTESWTTVTRRGIKKKVEVVKGDATTASPPLAKPTAPPPSTKGEKKKRAGGGRSAEKKATLTSSPPVPRPRRIRPPKSAAILLTMAPVEEGVQMETTGPDGAPSASRGLGEVMAGVRGQINLADFGVASLRPKRAATGGMLYEVPGQESGPKADRLADALRALLGPKGVKVSRPVKREDLRVTGLDDATTNEEVAEAAAAAGGCAAGDIKVGRISRSPRGGLGSVWVQCPAVAAKKIADGGRLLIGWVAAKVEALPARPLQCFRCLGSGHTRASCKAEADRSGLCYRCGQPGHTAAGCSAGVRCPYCSGHNLPAEHRYGARACAAGKQPGRGPKKAAAVAPLKKAPAEKPQAPAYIAAPSAGGTAKKKKTAGKKKRSPPPAAPTPVEAGASREKEVADGASAQRPPPPSSSK